MYCSPVADLAPDSLDGGGRSRKKRADSASLSVEKVQQVQFEVDIAAIGYPAVRHAFNETLQLCVDKLSRADLKLAEEILGLAALDELSPGAADMLADTALYSCKGTPGLRAGTRRAIDRIAPKLPVKRDPLKAKIAAQLPAANFSVFAAERAHEQGGILAQDLFDDGRFMHIMDQALATQAAIYGEILFTGRFVDLGPWHIGFGIVVPLRKSEALAIRLAVSDGDDIEIARNTLHELIYPSHLHSENLVMTALEPVITALALAIDTDMLDMTDLATGLGSLLPGKPTPKRNRKAVSA